MGLYIIKFPPSVYHPLILTFARNNGSCQMMIFEHHHSIDIFKLEIYDKEKHSLLSTIYPYIYISMDARVTL